MKKLGLIISFGVGIVLFGAFFSVCKADSLDQDFNKLEKDISKIEHDFTKNLEKAEKHGKIRKRNEKYKAGDQRGDIRKENSGMRKENRPDAPRHDNLNYHNSDRHEPDYWHESQRMPRNSQ